METKAIILQKMNKIAGHISVRDFRKIVFGGRALRARIVVYNVIVYQLKRPRLLNFSIISH